MINKARNFFFFFSSVKWTSFALCCFIDSLDQSKLLGETVPTIISNLPTVLLTCKVTCKVQNKGVLINLFVVKVSK